MTGLYHWILNGRGRGKRYLLYLAVLFAAAGSFVVYSSWNGILKAPAMSMIAAQMPEMKVQNGQLILPEDSYQDITWSMPSMDSDKPTAYHLVIDTQSDDLDSVKAPTNGIYLSRKNVYVLNDGKVAIQPLENIPDFEIKQGELIPVLQHGNVRFSWLLFFGLSIILFVSLYIWSLIYALFSYFLTMFIPGESYSFPVRRRLSVVSLICAYIFVLPLAFWGFYLGVFMFFITVLIFMSIFLAGLPKLLINPIDN